MGVSGQGREGMSKQNLHWGTALDTFLSEDGIREAAKAEAVAHIVAWRLTRGMKRQGVTKATLACGDNAVAADTENL
jgi:hypothetical protein